MPTPALVNYNAARTALAKAARVDEVKSIRDKAIAMQAYAKQAKDRELIGYATEIRMGAERRAGQLLKEMEKAKGTKGQLTGKQKGTSKGKGGGRGRAKAVSSGDNKKRPPEKTLAELGVTKTQSSRWQKLADKSEKDFEATVAVAKDKSVTSTEKVQSTADKEAGPRCARARSW